MTRTTILDTGVLIAYLMPKDKFHAWAVSQLSQISTPVLTNEAVITEAASSPKGFTTDKKRF
jgi:predicted nucleic acid-binding protein